jgi:hypothetical protein
MTYIRHPHKGNSFKACLFRLFFRSELRLREAGLISDKSPEEVAREITSRCLRNWRLLNSQPTNPPKS